MRLISKTILYAAWLFAGTLTQAQTLELKQAAWDYLDDEATRLGTANQNIWSYAETSLEETKSSAELQNLLRARGFSIEAGVANMPSAFVATYGTGSPVIGILAEFDALPGVSQAAEPLQKPGPEAAAGHACGHSVFGVGSAGAAMAIADLMEQGKISGTIKLYGTPAEETGIGKVYMLRDGYFKNDDIIFSWHPGARTLVPYGESMALVNVKFRFRGSAAHAAAQPYAGRSALDAVELMNMGVNMMREHIREDARIHYVITNGGGQPNVVPPEAEVWYYIRAFSFDDVATYFARVEKIAEGAAMMTETTLEAVEIQSEIHEIITPRAVAELMHKNLELVGPPRWTDQELEFARTTQRNFTLASSADFDADSPALDAGIMPLATKPIRGSSSTDVGDVSWFVPVGSVMVAGYGYGLPVHSWPVVAATGTSIGERSLITAAKTIAGAAIDVYQDSELLMLLQEDFATTRGDREWKTLIPEGQRAPDKIK